MNKKDILEELKEWFNNFDLDSIKHKPEEYIQAISNLIAENKELKEENNILKQEKEYLECVVDSDKDNYIPKSKVEEIIQTMNTNILNNILNAEKFDCDYIGQCRFAKYVLQSLLGKE